MTFYHKLQPLEQFEIVCMVAGLLLLSAVILREYFNDREIRIVARLLGAAGFVVMTAFSWRMAFTVEKMELARANTPSQVADNIALSGIRSDGMRSISTELHSIIDAYQSEAVRAGSGDGGSEPSSMGFGSGIRAGSYGLNAAKRMFATARRAGNAESAEF